MTIKELEERLKQLKEKYGDDFLDNLPVYVWDSAIKRHEIISFDVFEKQELVMEFDPNEATLPGEE